MQNLRRTWRAAALLSAGLVLTLLSSAQTEPQQQQANRAAQEAEQRVSLSAATITQILRNEPGLLLAVKKALVRKAYEQGRILDPTDLSDDALFQLLQEDNNVRILATLEIGWVGDVVQALIDLGVHEGAVGKIFNIGSDEEVSINELASIIKEVTRSSSPIEHVPYEQVYGKDFEDMYRRVPDLGRIRAAIGYSPTRRLREIVQSVADSLVERRLYENGVPANAAANLVAEELAPSLGD